MKHRLSLYLSREGVGLFAIFYVLAAVAEAPFRWYTKGQPAGYRPDLTVAGLRWLVIIIVAFGYGNRRGWGYHPFHQSGYCRWLAQTPWCWGRPLPLGSLTLCAEDLVVVGGLAALAWLDVWMVGAVVIPLRFMAGFGPTAVVIAFIWPYLFGLWVAVRRARPVLVAAGAIAPLAVYPSITPWSMIVVPTVCYGLLVEGVRQTLRHFPWEEPEWTEDRYDQRLQGAFRRGLITWPFNKVGPSVVRPRVSFFAAVTSSALIAWWCHVAMGLWVRLGKGTHHSWEAITDSLAQLKSDPPPTLWLAFVGLVALVRWFIYRTDGGPPISIWTRLRTGRLILPRHDHVYFAPICVLLWGFAGPRQLVELGLPPVAVFGFSLFGLLLLALSLGPTRESWQLTGHIRLGKPMITVDPPGR
jgi:hypothetical protein